jgi:NAD(P)H-dependent FMN reductase
VADPVQIALILGSTREGRVGDKVARWIHALAAQRDDMRVELVDLKDWPLPFFQYSKPPKLIENNYPSELERRWVATVEHMDGYIWVFPEYNHGYPAVLKNALDYVYTGWNRKPVSLVSYGGLAGGVRAAQQLRQVAIELQMAPLRDEVNIPLAMRAFDDSGQPLDASLAKRAGTMFEQLIWWSRTLRMGRQLPPQQ